MSVTLSDAEFTELSVESVVKKDGAAKLYQYLIAEVHQELTRYYTFITVLEYAHALTILAGIAPGPDEDGN